MGTMAPDELARLWRQEKLSVEMAIGHITQNLVQIQSMIDTQRQLLHSSLEQQRQLLLTLQEALPTMASSPPLPPPKKKRKTS
jgi:small-conductance mechanosensitive channel